MEIKNQNYMLREKLNLSNVLLERRSERDKLDSYIKINLKA